MHKKLTRESNARPERPKNAPTMTSKQHALLAIPAFACSVFAVYGSFVPLNFQPRPLDQAWQDFLNIPYLSLGISSRADWVANILLFIPLAFLWLGAIWPRTTVARAFASALVAMACASLSVGIEF